MRLHRGADVGGEIPLEVLGEDLSNVRAAGQRLNKFVGMMLLKAEGETYWAPVRDLLVKCILAEQNVALCLGALESALAS